MNDKVAIFICELASLGNPNVFATREAGDGSYRPQRRKFGMDAAKLHLANAPNYGLYVVDGNKTRALVFDLDDHDNELSFHEVAAKAKLIAELLSLSSLKPIMFRSGGGAGVHVWVVFDKPQAAAKLRTYALRVLGQLGLKSGTKGLAQGQVEIFPKQDTVEPNGLGSLIALPH